MSLIIYTGLILAVGLERLLELRIATRNAVWSRQRGGIEYGREHYPFMVVLHTAFLIGCVAEVWLLRPEFKPWLFASMLIIALASQALRWWVIRTLKERWNTRVIIVPNLPAIQSGPYRWLSHPNYVAVVAEGFALPLMHGAWITALVFSIANLILLRTRILVENAALAQLPTMNKESHHAEITRPGDTHGHQGDRSGGAPSFTGSGSSHAL